MRGRGAYALQGLPLARLLLEHALVLLSRQRRLLLLREGKHRHRQSQPRLVSMHSMGMKEEEGEEKERRAMGRWGRGLSNLWGELGSLGLGREAGRRSWGVSTLQIRRGGQDGTSS